MGRRAVMVPRRTFRRGRLSHPMDISQETIHVFRDRARLDSARATAYGGERVHCGERKNILTCLAGGPEDFALKSQKPDHRHSDEPDRTAPDHPRDQQAHKTRQQVAEEHPPGCAIVRNTSLKEREQSRFHEHGYRQYQDRSSDGERAPTCFACSQSRSVEH